MTYVRSSIVGSLPKPSWLAEPERLRAVWRLAPNLLTEGQDDAVRVWLAEQARAGLSIVTDGEQRRRHYIWEFLAALAEIDFEHPGARRSRGARYAVTTPAPRILSELHWPGPVLLPALRFAQGYTDRPIKVTLPGPMTVADSLIDEAGGRTDAELALAYAPLLNQEARALAAAGASIIQIDEPCFNIYLDEVADWGLQALERALEGIQAIRAIHVCYGYGVPQVLAWKRHNQDWRQYERLLPLLARSSVDQVSLECAAPGVDLAVLERLEDKDVMVGVIDVGTERVETPELVAQRIEAALRYVEARHMVAGTDCGLVPRSRVAAIGKLQALGRGTALVNGVPSGLKPTPSVPSHSSSGCGSQIDSA